MFILFLLLVTLIKIITAHKRMQCSCRRTVKQQRIIILKDYGDKKHGNKQYDVGEINFTYMIYDLAAMNQFDFDIDIQK